MTWDSLHSSLAAGTDLLVIFWISLSLGIILAFIMLWFVSAFRLGFEFCWILFLVKYRMPTFYFLFIVVIWNRLFICQLLISRSNLHSISWICSLLYDVKPIRIWLQFRFLQNKLSYLTLSKYRTLHKLCWDDMVCFEASKTYYQIRRSKDIL